MILVTSRFLSAMAASRIPGETLRLQSFRWCIFAWFLSVLSCWVMPRSGLAAVPAEAGVSTAASTPAPETVEPSGKVNRIEIPSIFKRHESVTIQANEIVDSVLVLDGDVEVNGEVREALIVLGGNVTVTGTIRKGALVVGGNIDVKERGRLRQPVTVLGGGLNADHEAKVRPTNLVIPAEWFAPIQGAIRWVKEGVFKLRPLPPSVVWVWYVFGAILIAYSMLLLVLPRPAMACMTVLVDRPVLSYFLGMLALFGLLLITPFVMVFAFTGIGFLLLALISGCGAVALGVGRIGVLQFLGHVTARVTGARLLDRPWLAFALGVVLTVLLYTVPIVGALTWLALCPLTVGGLILAAYRGLVPPVRRSPEEAPVADVPPADAGPLGGRSTPDVNGPGVGSTAGAAAFAAPVSAAPRSMLEAMGRRPAGFWHRSLATFLDLVLVALLLGICGVHGFRYFLLGLMIYHVILWGWWGTTVGGRILGLQLMQQNGSAPDPLTALVRCLAAFFSAIPLFLGFVWAGWSSTKESWHDRLTGTRVVRAS